MRAVRVLAIAIMTAAALVGCKDDSRPSVAQKPQATFTAMSWNLCAGVLWHCPYPGDSGAKIDAVVRNIESGGASVVLLQETCSSLRPMLEQALFDRLKQQWTVKFTPVYTKDPDKLVPEGCNDTLPFCVRLKKQNDDFAAGKLKEKPKTVPDWCRAPLTKSDYVDRWAPRGEYGLITAMRGEALLATHEALLSPPNKERRVAACMQQDLPAKIYVCNAHLSTSGDDPDAEFRVKQVGRLHELAESGQRQGYRSLVGGDFNTTPATSVYRTGSDGVQLTTPSQLLEQLYLDGPECAGSAANGANNPTAGSEKIDYLFAGTGIRVENCAVGEATYSDHHLIRGKFAVIDRDATPAPSPSPSAQPSPRPKGNGLVGVWKSTSKTLTIRSDKSVLLVLNGAVDSGVCTGNLTSKDGKQIIVFNGKDDLSACGFVNNHEVRYDAASDTITWWNLYTRA